MLKGAEGPRDAAAALFLAGRELKLCRHFDQFRERASFHFPHGVAAVDLHGDFTGSEIKSYLFIEHA